MRHSVLLIRASDFASVTAWRLVLAARVRATTFPARPAGAESTVHMKVATRPATYRQYSPKRLEVMGARGPRQGGAQV